MNTGLEFEHDGTSGRSDHPRRATLHFLLTPTALVAANTGRAFSHRGLDAICGSNLSDKRGRPIAGAERAAALVEEVHRRHLEDYKRN